MLADSTGILAGSAGIVTEPISILAESTGILAEPADKFVDPIGISAKSAGMITACFKFRLFQRKNQIF